MQPGFGNRKTIRARTPLQAGNRDPLKFIARGLKEHPVLSSVNIKRCLPNGKYRDSSIFHTTKKIRCRTTF